MVLWYNEYSKTQSSLLYQRQISNNEERQKEDSVLFATLIQDSYSTC